MRGPRAPEPQARDAGDDRKARLKSGEKSAQARTLTDHLRAVRGRHIARFLSKDYVVVREMKSDEVETGLDKMNGDVSGVILDGEVNQRLLDHLVEKGIEYVAAREFRGIIKRPMSIRLLKIA